MARDIALAGQNQPVNPTFQDTAPSTQPTSAPRTRDVSRSNRRVAEPGREAPRVQSAPAASSPVAAPDIAPPSAVAPQKSIAAGTVLAVSSGSKVCTSSNEVGDKLVATLNTAVAGANGAVIPAGSTIVLEVTSLTPGDSPDNARIGFRVRSLVMNGETHDLTASVTPESPLQKNKMANADPNADKTKVIGGAVIGGILGNVIGHSAKGTVIGAAAGAAAGAVAAKTSERWEACLPQGAALRLTLTSPVVI